MKALWCVSERAAWDRDGEVSEAKRLGRAAQGSKSAINSSQELIFKVERDQLNGRSAIFKAHNTTRDHYQQDRVCIRVSSKVARKPTGANVDCSISREDANMCANMHNIFSVIQRACC